MAMSAYNEQANFELVKFLQDKYLLEVELNEMQEIQLGKIRQLTKQLMGQGLVGLGTSDIVNGVLTIANDVAIVNGDILELDELNVNVALGQTVYLNVKHRTVTHLDEIPKKGNLQSSEVIKNEIKDTRYNDVTSERIQTVFTLTTNTSEDPEDGLFYPILTIEENGIGELVTKKVVSGGQTALDREITNIRTMMDTLLADIEARNNQALASLQEHFETYNEYAKSKDDQGIYRVAELRRVADGTLYQRSTLSQRDARGHYVVQTVETFGADGVTLKSKFIFDIQYDQNGQMIGFERRKGA